MMLQKVLLGCRICNTRISKKLALLNTLDKFSLKTGFFRADLGADGMNPTFVNVVQIIRNFILALLSSNIKKTKTYVVSEVVSVV